MTTTKFSRPKKALGQNFLVDQSVRKRIIAAAELSEIDTVVEIGPGRGFLTGLFSQSAGDLIAIELDKTLCSKLADIYPNIRIIHADAREIPIDSFVDPKTEYKIVANLPYYAASPIVRRFLEASHKPTRMVIMVQREVGKAMVAMPGKMGLISVSTQVYGKPTLICHAAPRAFRPSPKVWSSVVQINVYPKPSIDFESPNDFFEIVRAGFSTPRKQLKNSLANGLQISTEESVERLRAVEIDPTRRAQTLSLDEWGQLYSQWRNFLSSE